MFPLHGSFKYRVPAGDRIIFGFPHSSHIASQCLTLRLTTGEAVVDLPYVRTRKGDIEMEKKSSRFEAV